VRDELQSHYAAHWGLAREGAVVSGRLAMGVESPIGASKNGNVAVRKPPSTAPLTRKSRACAGQLGLRRNNRRAPPHQRALWSKKLRSHEPRVRANSAMVPLLTLQLFASFRHGGFQGG